ncbi:MAG: hypothetical protein ACI92E_000735, partial [Oceanicoccus sp.]
MVININNLGSPINSGSRGEKAEVASSSERTSTDSAPAAKTPDGS